MSWLSSFNSNSLWVKRIRKNILKKLVAISIKYFECKDCNNLPPLLRPLCEVLVQLEPFILVQGILQNNKLCLKKD